MHNQKTAILAIFTNEIGRQITLSLSSTLPQIQTAAEWLVEQSHPKTDLKIACIWYCKVALLPRKLESEW